jgi:hypothetical protein
MRRFLLLLILIWYLLIGLPGDQILSIHLVIPSRLIPLYEWLADFPGFLPQEVDPPPAQETPLPTYHL